MEIIELDYPHHLSKNDLPKTACAIGFFDGVHLGHQKVIKTAVQYANERQIESAVITFHPHPTIVLSNGEKSVKYITPMAVKKRVLKSLGVDRLYVITFNKQLSSLLPEQFIDHFITGLNIQHLVAGFDFTYGFKGAGNMDNINEFSKGNFTYTTVEKITQANEKISSTHIRALIADGNMKAVNQLLGRPLQTIGTVIKGEQRGRSIGFPTANLQTHPNGLLPKTGVYAVKVTVNDHTYKGMANLGFRPTFEDEQYKPVLEIHLFDMSMNLYDCELTVDWYAFIRDEKKFTSVDDLIAQLKQDEKNIRNYFNSK